jgi:hypothetical protein
LAKGEPSSHHDERAVAADWAPGGRERSRRLRVRLSARKLDVRDRVRALAEEVGRIKRELEGLHEAI